MSLVFLGIQLLAKVIGHIVMGLEESSLLHVLDESLQIGSLTGDVFCPLGLASNIVLRDDKEVRDIA